MTDSFLTRLRATKSKLILTFLLYFSFSVYGIGFSILSPTLLDIAEHLDKEIEDVAIGVVGRAISYALFALVFGWGFTKMNRQIGFLLCFIFTGIVQLAVPFSSSLAMFIALQVIIGATTSGIDVAGNAWLLEMWQEKANPFMQGMHFSYAIGMTISPILAAPYLSKLVNVSSESQGHNRTLYSESSIWIPYSITTGILVFTGLVILVMYFIIPYRQGTRDQLISETREDTEPRKYRDYKLLILFGSLLMSFYTGLEMNCFSFLPDFAVFSRMNLSKETGAYMTSVMSAAFALFRGVSILEATKFSAKTMISIHILMVCVGNGIIASAGYSGDVNVMWVGIAVIGSGMSCMFPTIYSYLEERIEVTNFLTGILVFSSAITSVVIPIIVGLAIKKLPMIFVYVNTFSLAVTLVVRMVLVYLDKRNVKTNE